MPIQVLTILHPKHEPPLHAASHGTQVLVDSNSSVATPNALFQVITIPHPKHERPLHVTLNTTINGFHHCQDFEITHRLQQVAAVHDTAHIQQLTSSWGFDVGTAA